MVMKIIHAYGGAIALWRSPGFHGWFWEFSGTSRNKARRIAVIDGKTWYLWPGARHGFGHALTLRDARKRLVNSLKAAA